MCYCTCGCLPYANMPPTGKCLRAMHLLTPFTRPSDISHSNASSFLPSVLLSYTYHPPITYEHICSHVQKTLHLQPLRTRGPGSRDAQKDSSHLRACPRTFSFRRLYSPEIVRAMLFRCYKSATRHEQHEIRALLQRRTVFV